MARRDFRAFPGYGRAKTIRGLGLPRPAQQRCTMGFYGCRMVRDSVYILADLAAGGRSGSLGGYLTATSFANPRRLNIRGRLTSRSVPISETRTVPARSRDRRIPG